MFYFISDTHFLHDKDFCYAVRGFNSAYEMSEYIINKINSVVQEDDTLFVLGDIYLGGDEGAEYFKRINCNNIHIIIGNHDTKNKIDTLFNITTGKINNLCYADIIKWEKYSFYLSHFPTLTGYNEKHLNTALINLFGHTHQKEKFFKDDEGNNIPWMYNVGCDAQNCTPVSIEQIIEDCREEFNKYCARRDKKIKEERNGNICNE